MPEMSKKEAVFAQQKRTYSSFVCRIIFMSLIFNLFLSPLNKKEKHIFYLLHVILTMFFGCKKNCRPSQSNFTNRSSCAATHVYSSHSALIRSFVNPLPCLSALQLVRKEADCLKCSDTDGQHAVIITVDEPSIYMFAVSLFANS